MPGNPDEIDPFQDKGDTSQQGLQTLRLQVGLTFAAGVLSIVTVAAVLILVSRGSAPDQGSKPVAVGSTLPSPAAITPSAVPGETSPSTATPLPGQSRKPPGATGGPGPGPTTPLPENTSTPVVVALEAVSCPSPVLGGQNVTCQVRLTAAAQSDLSVTLSSSASATLAVPSSVTIFAGSDSASFDAASNPVTANETVTVTATLSGDTRTSSVAVEAP